ncbi:Phosphopantetheine attachment site, partial [Pedobacter terrae]
LGGDSIITIQVVSRARRAGIEIQPRDVFQHQTIAELAGAAGNQKPRQENQADRPLTGTVRMLPVQQFFFEQQFANPNHYNQDVLLAIDKNISEQVIEKACTELVEMHDALRLSYFMNDGEWAQQYTQKAPLFSTFSIQDGKQIDQICSGLQKKIDIHNGPIGHFAFIQTPEEDSHNRLFIVLHHLVVDGVSWRIIIEDLQDIIEKRTTHPKTASVKTWVNHLEEYANDQRTLTHIPFWQKTVQAASPLKTDRTDREKSTAEISVEMDSKMTSMLIQNANSAYLTEINDLLVTALAETFREYTNQGELVFAMEGHGREDIRPGADTSHSVGWFTSIFPVLVDIGRKTEWSDKIRTVKEQLREIPDKGI